MDRRGTASASPKNASPGSDEVLGPARFSRVRSALGKATFFFTVLTFRVLSGHYVAFIAAPSRVLLRYSAFIFYPLTPFSIGLSADCLRSCSSSSPDNQAYPEARARARAREPVVLLVRLLYDRRTRVSAASRSRELPDNFRER